MPTWVGNEANQLTSEKAEEGKPTIYFGLNLFATQTPYEVDSFGKDYDIAADPGYDPFAEKDAEMLAKDPKYSFRTSDGRYWQYASRDQERGIITYLAGNGLEATLIRDIGAASRSTTGGGSDWNGQHAVLDLNGHTYTFGRLEFDQNTSNEASGTSLVFKNGTMEGTINFEDILKCRNSMQSVTLDNVTMKWDNPRAWDADKSNYRGLNLGTKSSGSVYTVKDSTLNCNAQFYTTADFSNPADRPVVNVTNTTVNGRLSGSNVDMTVKGCTVNGKVYCNSSFSSTTTVNINNSTINGNAYFDAASSQWNEVTITDTAINGNLQTNYSRNNVHITLTDVTVTGTLCWANQGLTSKVPADKVTIVSGTYGFDPTAYLASGSAAAQNAEGLWIVTAG